MMDARTATNNALSIRESLNAISADALRQRTAMDAEGGAEETRKGDAQRRPPRAQAARRPPHVRRPDRSPRALSKAARASSSGSTPG
jgi:hypothetical protein